MDLGVILINSSSAKVGIHNINMLQEIYGICVSLFQMDSVRRRRDSNVPAYATLSLSAEGFFRLRLGVKKFILVGS